MRGSTVGCLVSIVLGLGCGLGCATAAPGPTAAVPPARPCPMMTSDDAQTHPDARCMATGPRGAHGRGHRHGHGDGHPHGRHAHAQPNAYAHHGHGPHRFDDPEAWAARFEDPARDAWQRPEEVIAAMGLSPTSVVADIGSASGYFPVRIAGHVPQGRVWGIDIEPAMVRYLNARAQREGISNLFSVLGTASEPLIPEPVDVVLMVNTYHHIESRPAYFAGVAGSLKPGARIVIVDFKMGQQPVGPPDAMKVAPEVMASEMAEAGYTLTKRDDTTLPHQHIFVFARAAP